MYKIQTETLGIVRAQNGKSVALTIPEDSLVEVVSQQSVDGTVDVRWKDQIVNIFAVDLEDRGMHVETGSSSAA